MKRIILTGAALLAALTACAPQQAEALAIVPAATPDAVTVDYFDGAWHLTRTSDGYGVAVDCPSEDSCSATYSDGAWRIIAAQ